MEKSDLESFPLSKAKDELAKMLHGVTRSEALANKVCVSCGGPATEFRGDGSLHEYHITGFCQKCQDEIFGMEE